MRYFIKLFLLVGIITLAGAFQNAYGSSSRHAGTQPAAEELTAPVKEITSLDALSRWMTYYYLHPQPELLIPALIFADKQGLIQGDSAAPLQAFTSKVLAQNPQKLKEWFSQFGPMSSNGKTLLLTAIWWSNSKESKDLLDKIASELPEKSRSEFNNQLKNAPPAIETMDISSPDVLDMLWASFSATGDTQYVKRLMTTLPWGRNDSKDLPKMLIASAARWSLVSNIIQHARVKECCQEMQKTDADLRPYLDKALAEATGKTSPAGEKNGQAPENKQTGTTSPGKTETTSAPDKSQDKEPINKSSNQ